MATGAAAQTKPDAARPHLQKQGTAVQLIVDGQPFLVRGAELNNSSASSLDYMKPLWPRLVATHLNTVLATVSWELIEPAEGKFDFSSVDGLIREARANDLRLVLLWFASWKNGKSNYQPPLGEDEPVAVSARAKPAGEKPRHADDLQRREP